MRKSRFWITCIPKSENEPLIQNYNTVINHSLAFWKNRPFHILRELNKINVTFIHLLIFAFIKKNRDSHCPLCPALILAPPALTVSTWSSTWVCLWECLKLRTVAFLSVVTVNENCKGLNWTALQWAENINLCKAADGGRSSVWMTFDHI